VVIHKIDIKSIPVLKPEDNSPVCPDSDGPAALQFASQWVQSVTRKVQFLQPGRGIQNREQVFYPCQHIGPDWAGSSPLEQAPEACMPKGLYYSPILKRQLSLVKTHAEIAENAEKNRLLCDLCVLCCELFP
jgi:hypothetical protein